MWSLLYGTDQLREMPSTDLSALVSAKHFPRLICGMQQLTEPPVSNPIIICFHKIGPNYCVILQVYIHYELTQCYSEQSKYGLR